MVDLTDRIVVNSTDIIKERMRNTPRSKWAELFPNYTEYSPKLYKTMQLPSYVHGYSLAIEYMREWFIKKFPKDYFKTIYVNGSHILDNWKNWNNYNIKREKPMLAIVPTLSTDWDRENLDFYMADANMILHQSNYDESFIKDYANMEFLYLRLREMEMNFTFRIRVNTRAQQLDLMNKMELWFRVGTTMQDNLSADFHIPTDLLLAMAKDAHFEIDEEKQLPKDLPAFINYLNQHSSAPVIFKMRAVNQQPAFFVRARNLFTHIALRDKITIDEGERTGKLDNNFHLEMNVRLRMPIPHFYAYMAEIPTTESIQVSEKKPELGIYTINNFDIRPENEMGWPSIAVTSYFAEKGEKYIDISSLFASKEWPVSKVLFSDLKLGISPEGFIDTRVYHDLGVERLARFHMDYANMRIVLEEDVDIEQYFEIAMYADMKYVTDRLSTMENYNERVTSSRLSYDENIQRGDKK